MSKAPVVHGASSSLSEKAAEAIVSRIARKHFGHRPKRLRRLAGGLTNAVFSLKVREQQIVVRINADITKVHDFQKERWAMDRAREEGVPTAPVFEVANDPEGPAYMIEGCVMGTPGHLHPDRIGIAEQLGAAARSIHRIRTSGSGAVFDWSRNLLSRRGTWGEFLDLDVKAAERAGFLARRRMISQEQVGALLRTLDEMRRWSRPSTLQHGDLRLKNTLVDPASGRVVALIDWENCLSGPAPCWDFSIALHDLGIDLKEAFLGGYGMTPRRYAEIAPFVNALNLLNYVTVIEQALLAKDRTRLAWLRARLHGWLDLHRLSAG